MGAPVNCTSVFFIIGAGRSTNRNPAAATTTRSGAGVYHAADSVVPLHCLRAG